jgi:hypothetical protein
MSFESTTIYKQYRLQLIKEGDSLLTIQVRPKGRPTAERLVSLFIRGPALPSVGSCELPGMPLSSAVRSSLPPRRDLQPCRQR